MNARAIWKGVIRSKTLEVPVKLYTAVEDSRVSFRLLHKSDGVPLQQRMVTAEGEAIEHGDRLKGYFVSADRVVLLTDTELEEIAISPSREIEVLRFVARSAVGWEWLDRPYYLGSDSGGESNVRALAAALEGGRTCGITRWVMRKREYAGALYGIDGGLVMVTLHRPGEVIDRSRLDGPSGRDLTPEEKALAAQLVGSLEGRYDPDEFQDTYAQKVRALVEAKRAGRRPPKARARARPKAPRSLADALRQSVRAASAR